jgi:hypothetical protein
MTWRDRILVDGSDRDAWAIARRDVIGAYDAKSLSKMQSVDKYLLAKLKDGTFRGTEATRQGHRWEPMMLAWAGIYENKALVHSPLERGFAATPDGIGNGYIAECKAKQNLVVKGPTLPEKRQIAWQFLCLPEFDRMQWIWMEIDEHGEPFHAEPKYVEFRRDDRELVDLTQRMLPIATDLLARLRAARAFEQELNAA